jgi:methanogenic corrinoid protein MtbC1
MAKPHHAEAEVALSPRGDPAHSPRSRLNANCYQFDHSASGDQETTGGDVTPHSLARILEGEIIPRLLLAHQDRIDLHPLRSAAGHVAPARVLDAESIAARALDSEAHVLLAHMEEQLLLGVDVETLLIDGLAPAARKLGLWWEDDRCDFVDVTMGLWRLQEVVHDLSSRYPAVTAQGSDAAGRQRGDRRAIFAAAPGEAHGFGALLVEELFRRAGWMTWGLQSVSRAELLAELADRWFDMVGLSVSTDAQLAALPELISAVRSASRNSDLYIMAGGWIFAQQPEAAIAAGADATAADARLAVKAADRWMAEKASAAIQRATGKTGAPRPRSRDRRDISANG